MSKELEIYAAKNMHQRFQYARQISEAGDLVPSGLRNRDGSPNPGKIYLVMETGVMLGIHPMAALSGINVIEGRATISPALMSALVRKAGHKLRVRTSGKIEDGTFEARVTIIRSDDPDFPFETVWTPHRAARAGLVAYTLGADGIWRARARSKSDKPLPWELFTEALCKARAISECVREAAEDSVSGAGYTHEELGALVDEEGEVVEMPTSGRDWKAEIDAADDRKIFALLLGQLKQSDDYTQELEGYLIARASVCKYDSREEGQKPSEAEQKANEAGREQDPGEATYEADGTPTDAPAAASESAQEAETAQPADDDEPSPEIAAEQSDDERAATGEMTPEEYEAYSAEQFAKEQAQK